MGTDSNAEYIGGVKLMKSSKMPRWDNIENEWMCPQCDEFIEWEQKNCHECKISLDFSEME